MAKAKKKLDPRVKARWVKALLSGRYKQAKHTLQNAQGANCCLGVLCRVLKVPRVSNRFGRLGDYSSSKLPNYVREKIGLSHSDEVELMDMNDALGKSFKQIAEYIREYL